MLAEARSYSLIAFQQALQICVTTSPEAARQWIVSVATWPVLIAGIGDGPVHVSKEHALTMLNDEMEAAGQAQMIDIAAVANELEAVGREIVMRVGPAPWRDKAVQTLVLCSERLNDLAKPKEHA